MLNETLMTEFIFGVLTLIIASLAFLFQVKDYRAKKIPRFSGRIGIDTNDGEGAKLFEFVSKYEGRIVLLDIYFDNDENYEINDEGIFYFSFYYDKYEKLNGGFEFRIEIKESDDFFYDYRWTSKRLKGNFKIIGFSGPQMGWFTAIMKPVNIDVI